MTFICEGATTALECVVCATPFEYRREAGPGRLRRFCSEQCRKERAKTYRKPPPAPPPLKRFTCAWCGEDGFATGPRKYHLGECLANGRDATRSAGGEYAPACRQEHTCGWCEKTFRPKRAGRTKFCGTECSRSWQAAVKRVTKRATFTVYRRPKPAPRPAPAPVTRYCPDCCTAPLQANAHRCGECKAIRADRAKHRGRERQKERRRADGSKAAQRKARKLKLRGVTVEMVNPITVLQRDKWTCQLCGIKTPRRLRGTYESRAPEIDHIVPISQGGEHSYSNVQCACRACNLSKSGRPLGQMRLFG